MGGGVGLSSGILKLLSLERRGGIGCMTVCSGQQSGIARGGRVEPCVPATSLGPRCGVVRLWIPALSCTLLLTRCSAVSCRLHTHTHTNPCSGAHAAGQRSGGQGHHRALRRPGACGRHGAHHEALRLLQVRVCVWGERAVLADTDNEQKFPCLFPCLYPVPNAVTLQPPTPTPTPPAAVPGSRVTATTATHRRCRAHTRCSTTRRCGPLRAPPNWRRTCAHATCSWWCSTTARCGGGGL